MRVFVDTNLWVYRLDRRTPDKARMVQRWLRETAQEHDIVISTQVMIELRAVVSRKLQPTFTTVQTRQALEALARLEVVETHAALVLDAHALAVAEQLQWFDALIAAAALRSRCTVLFSEDFNHGKRIAGRLLVQNPLM